MPTEVGREWDGWRKSANLFMAKTAKVIKWPIGILVFAMIPAAIMSILDHCRRPAFFPGKVAPLFSADQQKKRLRAPEHSIASLTAGQSPFCQSNSGVLWWWWGLRLLEDLGVRVHTDKDRRGADPVELGVKHVM